MVSVSENNKVAMSLENVIGGSVFHDVSFNGVNDTLILLGTYGKWLVIKEYGLLL